MGNGLPGLDEYPKYWSFGRLGTIPGWHQTVKHVPAVESINYDTIPMDTEPWTTHCNWPAVESTNYDNIPSITPVSIFSSPAMIVSVLLSRHIGLAGMGEWDKLCKA